jgi:hypothetical protein
MYHSVNMTDSRYSSCDLLTSDSVDEGWRHNAIPGNILKCLEKMKPM